MPVTTGFVDLDDTGGYPYYTASEAILLAFDQEGFWIIYDPPGFGGRVRAGGGAEITSVEALGENSFRVFWCIAEGVPLGEYVVAWGRGGAEVASIHTILRIDAASLGTWGSLGGSFTPRDGTARDDEGVIIGDPPPDVDEDGIPDDIDDDDDVIGDPTDVTPPTIPPDPEATTGVEAGVCAGRSITLTWGASTGDPI